MLGDGKMQDTYKGIGSNAGTQPSLVDRLARFEKPSTSMALVQLADTLIPYFALMGLMVFSTLNGWPVWTTLLLSLPAGAFLVRIFIFFHDCCHGSFLASRKAMNALGFFLGVLTFTPFDEWRHSHGIHHSTSGNLDRRGTGDVWTMTLKEYQGSSFYKLPRLLQWFSGNIGLHHIHHLRPRIPNYRLQACLEQLPELQLPSPLTIRKSLGSIHLNLWDEARHRLLSFHEARLM
jgi:fatty acid desaturase